MPASDDCGVAILGPEDDKFWHDHKGAGVNAIRTGTLLREADIVVVRFGEKYKQWNAAFDAGQAAALGTPLITLHPPEHDHALKEVDRAALAVAREPEQVVAILRYAIEGNALAAPARRRLGQPSTSRTISSSFRERTLNSRSQLCSSSRSRSTGSLSPTSIWARPPRSA